MTGTIAMVNKARGFSIIRGEDGHEYFAHIYKWKNQREFESVGPGEGVTFDPFVDSARQKTGSDGRRAMNVELQNV